MIWHNDVAQWSIMCHPHVDMYMTWQKWKKLIWYVYPVILQERVKKKLKKKAREIETEKRNWKKGNESENEKGKNIFSYNQICKLSWRASSPIFSIETHVLLPSVFITSPSSFFCPNFIFFHLVVAMEVLMRVMNKIFRSTEIMGWNMREEGWLWELWSCRGGVRWSKKDEEGLRFFLFSFY